MSAKRDAARPPDGTVGDGLVQLRMSLAAAFDGSTLPSRFNELVRDNARLVAMWEAGSDR